VVRKRTAPPLADCGPFSQIFECSLTLALQIRFRNKIPPLAPPPWPPGAGALGFGNHNPAPPWTVQSVDLTKRMRIPNDKIENHYYYDNNDKHTVPEGRGEPSGLTMIRMSIVAEKRD